MSDRTEHVGEEERCARVLAERADDLAARRLHLVIGAGQQLLGRLLRLAVEELPVHLLQLHLRLHQALQRMIK